MAPSNPKEPKLDSSGDLDTSANQTALEEVDKCQNELDSLNEKASEEILAVEQKYNKLRRPHYEKRNKVIEAIPDFWYNALVHHPQITSLLSAEEHECLRFLKSVDVEEFEDIKSGYKIKFEFRENGFFTNTEIVKEFNLVSTSQPVSKSTPIEWKEGKDLIKKANASKTNGRKRQLDSHPGFFSWFNNNEEPSMDDIAETIKDDIWVNPLSYYLGSDMENGHSDDDDEGDDLDESVVEVGDEDDDDEDEDDDDPEMYGEDDDDEEDDEDVEGEDGEDDDDDE